MRRDSRLSGILHVLLHMAEDGGPVTSEDLAKAMDTNPVVIRRIMAGLRESGLSIFLVEQNYGLAIDLADTVYILSNGQVVWQGSPGELESAAQVRETHLGV